jgi:hypothetical protein
LLVCFFTFGLRHRLVPVLQNLLCFSSVLIGLWNQSWTVLVYFETKQAHIWGCTMPTAKLGHGYRALEQKPKTISRSLPYETWF